MVRFKVWMIVAFAGVWVTGCQHSAFDTAQRYTSQQRDALGLEYLLIAQREDPGNPEIEEETALVLERLKWRTQTELQRLSPQRSGGAIISKERSLQDLISVSIALGLDNQQSETQRLARERKVSQQIIRSIEEALDNRLSRGVLEVSDLRLCREAQAIGGRQTDLKSKCERLSQELMVNAELAVGGAGFQTSGLAQRIAEQVKRRHFELFRIVTPSSGDNPNASWNVNVGPLEVDEQDWFVQETVPIRKWVERRDKNGKLVKQVVVKEPSAEEIADAEARGAPKPEAVKVEKQVWDEVRGLYTVYRTERELRLPFTSQLIDLRNGRSTFANHGVATTSSVREFFIFKGDARARQSEFENRPEGRSSAGVLESRQSMQSRALEEAERRILESLQGKVE